MSIVLTVLSRICEVLAALAALLLGISFTRIERSRYPLLRWVDDRRLVVLLAAVASVAAFPFLDEAKNRLAEKRQAATLAELKNMIARLGPEAQLESQSDVDYVAVGMIVGTERFKDQDYEAALDWFHAVDELVDSATLTAKIADCYFFSGQYREAIRFEQRAARQAPEWSGPPYIEAMSYYRLGMLEEALVAATRSCSLGFTGGCELQERLRRELRR